MSPKVKVKRLNDDATIPTYAKPGDAGADLYACEKVQLWNGMRKVVHTGISIELPEGYEAQVRPRSGLAIKKGVTVINAPGTVDAGYRGEIMVGLVNHSDEMHVVHPGDRIAQLVIKPVQQATFEEVDELSDSERGEGGFGSTGN